MNLEHDTQDGIDIVRLPARLMMSDAVGARARLNDIVANGGGKLIIDLTETSSIDSSGLGVLTSGLQAARRKGGDIYLVGMGATVRALFELTRLHTLFQVFDDTAGALKALR